MGMFFSDNIHLVPRITLLIIRNYSNWINVTLRCKKSDSLALGYYSLLLHLAYQNV